MVPVMLERERASVVVTGAAGTRVYLNGAASGVIPTTGEFVIPALVPGQSYALRFERDDYEPATANVEPAAGQQVAVSAALEPLPTSGPFEETFLGGLSGWEAPASWRTAKSVLVVTGPVVGLARDRRYRDFDATFGLRLDSARGAAWVVRARDAKNYYLFVVGGPSGRFPNQLRTYVVRDGQLDPDAPAGTLPLLTPLEVGETYRVHIRAVGNTIEHTLTPSRTGQEVSIGLFDDVKGTFALGGFGYVAPFGESFQVSGVSVRPVDASERVRRSPRRRGSEREA
jgi:hypothetical protein